MSVNSDESILNIWICALSRHGLHNDIMIWKRFQHYWPFVCGIHQSLVDSPHKGPVAWIFDVSFGVTLNKLLDKRTSGRWFNSLRPSDAYMCRWTMTTLVQIMACCLDGAKILSEQMFIYSITTLGTNFSENLIQSHTFSFKKMHLKMSSGECRSSCLGLNVLRCHASHVMLL